MINIKCESCKTDCSFAEPKYCINCHPLTKNFEEFKNDLKKITEEIDEINLPKNKWREIRRFTYHFLLYVPVCIIIYRLMGIEAELLWILGGVHIVIIPYICDWLVRIF